MNNLLRRRFFCISSIQDSQEYLTHCLINGNLNSTVFKGTLYELYVKSYLESNFHCFDLIKIGGANDNGADIIGRWNLLPFYEEIKHEEIGKLPVGASLLKTSIESKYFNCARTQTSLSDINLVVQCKNHKGKLGPMYIREAGIVLNHLKYPKNSSFMFIVSPNNLSTKAIDQMNNTQSALIHLSITPLTCENHSKDLKKWKGGNLSSIYINNYARKLLMGFKMEQQLKKYILD
ncbi:unnamed protein product [Candida verbasci]|uniref:Required for respiratory growth protein 7, mitochondrial n=1 Tax=Candida verbasci TaxID=1227364 RepID=A0A9W4XJP1_9ASCO|nr:unnamed protein product [Candida verbasci]